MTTGVAVHAGFDAPARHRLETRRRHGRRGRARRCELGDGRGKRVLGASLDGGNPRERGVAGRPRRQTPHASTRGVPSVSVPVLSSTTVSTDASRSSGSPPLMRTPAAAPRPLATMTAVGTARPIAHGQAMISTATAAVSACTSDGGSGTTPPDVKVATAIEITTGTKTRGDAIGQALDRGLRALRVAHQPDDLGEHARRARPWSPRSRRRPAVLTVAPITRSPGCLSTGIDSPVSIDSSTAPVPADDDAVHRKALARPDEDDVARPHAGDGHVLLAAIAPDAGGRRLERRHLAQRPRGLPLGARLHRVAEQHQRDDQDDGFVVDVGSAAALLKRVRRERGGQRIEERRAGADRDQRVHVGVAVPEGRPGPHVEWRRPPTS